MVRFVIMFVNSSFLFACQDGWPIKWNCFPTASSFFDSFPATIPEWPRKFLPVVKIADMILSRFIAFAIFFVASRKCTAFMYKSIPAFQHIKLSSFTLCNRSFFVIESIKCNNKIKKTGKYIHDRNVSRLNL